MAKRKAEAIAGNVPLKPALKKSKKTSTNKSHSPTSSFRTGLFDTNVLDTYTKEYAESRPYKHAVIGTLMNDTLLRSVRDEVRENVHFTPKETDIYKIHQSGDLANLDGLDDEALEKLPSLLRLRDALYSPEFRRYVAHITGSGELSGRKTDMAVNVYTPGCHLLCHDDVIGSRRVSYILYLTDPDIPWQAEWGGALRLFPTTEHVDEEGVVAKTPSPDYEKCIPPAWNQLSFFAVQPGESFHDVEEVYHAATKEQQEKEGGRVRMAISGWFHIPQEGEEGYVAGEESRLAEKSSLVQLQTKGDLYDYPKEEVHSVQVSDVPLEEQTFSEEDMDFLLKYMTPMYLTPDTLGQVSEHFEEQSSITLDNILGKKFSARLREYIEAQETASLPETRPEIEASSSWKVARPPHKHRYLFQHTINPSSGAKFSNGKANLKCKTKAKSKAKAAPKVDEKDMTPLDELLNVFLPSRQFRQWLELASACQIENFSLMARRFRRGLDYSLATAHEGQQQLEISLSLTPTPGWGADEPVDRAENGEQGEDKQSTDDEDTMDAEGGAETLSTPKKNSKPKHNGEANTTSAGSTPYKPRPQAAPLEPELEESTTNDDEDDDVGGHEAYMAADEKDDADAAIYKASSGEEDDNILFVVPATWNKLSIVLRDGGVLKFVKYVSRKAKGDRWDVSGSFGVRESDEDGSDESGSEDGVGGLNSDDEMVDFEDGSEASDSGVESEETWEGFSDGD